MFPYRDPIDVGELLNLDDELVLSASEIVDLLRGQISANRRQRIDSVVAERTYSVVPVMEGLHDLGNVAAVLRSAEGLGYQAAHVIDTQSSHKTSQRITQGADKWMDVVRWRQTASCVAHLREGGYRIVVTHLDAEMTLEEVDFTQPTALVFGNELEGVSARMLQQADGRCVIPIHGFVQSFNISVAAALSLYEAMRQRVDRLGAQGDLQPSQQEILRAHFYIRAANQPERLLPLLWKRRLESKTQ